MSLNNMISKQKFWEQIECAIDTFCIFPYGLRAWKHFLLIIDLKVVCTAKDIKKVNPASQSKQTLSQNISIIWVKIKYYVVKNYFCWVQCADHVMKWQQSIIFKAKLTIRILCWPVTTFWGSSWALQGLKGGSKMSPEHLVPVIRQKIFKGVSVVETLMYTVVLRKNQNLRLMCQNLTGMTYLQFLWPQCFFIT